jgi:hypothetical protein
MTPEQSELLVFSDALPDSSQWRPEGLSETSQPSDRGRAWDSTSPDARPVSQHEQATAFVEAYGETWENWDIEGFVDLFIEDVVYVVHPTEETILGKDALRTYVRKEEEEQGPVSVRMGKPLIERERVMAEFWVTTAEGAEPMTFAGCLIARVDPESGRCTLFREYWFDIGGRFEPNEDWGT